MKIYSEESKSTNVLLKQDKVLMNIDEITIESTTSTYNIEIEIPYTKDFEEFLKEESNEHLLRYVISKDIYGYQSIVINTRQNGIIWIGLWYNQWKSKKK